MSKFNKDENKNKEDNKSTTKEGTGEKVELTIEEKLKDLKKSFLRSLADSENQRRRFEKEIKDAFDFGGFNFAKEMLTSLDNLQRAKNQSKMMRCLKRVKNLKNL